MQYLYKILELSVKYSQILYKSLNALLIVNRKTQISKTNV